MLDIVYSNARAKELITPEIIIGATVQKELTCQLAFVAIHLTRDGNYFDTIGDAIAVLMKEPLGKIEEFADKVSICAASYNAMQEDQDD